MDIARGGRWQSWDPGDPKVNWEVDEIVEL